MNKSMFVIVVQMIAALTSVVMVAKHNEPGWERCTVQCGKFVRTMPSMYCIQKDAFKDAHVEKIRVFKKRMVARNTLLLHGIAGAGKSMLAQAFAQDVGCGNNYIKINASSLVTVEQESSAAAIRAIFERVKKSQKQTVIIIEEVDSIADVTCADSNKNQDRKAAYQELNLQIDDIENNHNIFVICTTNHVRKCANEFLSRFELFEVEPLTKEERKDTLQGMFFHDDFFLLDAKAVTDLCTAIKQNTEPAVWQKMSTIEAQILEIDRLIDTLPPLKAYQATLYMNIRQKITDLKNSIVALQSSGTEQKNYQCQHEIAALVSIIKTWELRLNIYYFIAPSSPELDRLVNKTDKAPWRFLKYLTQEIILHCYQHHNGVISEEIVNGRLCAAKLRFIKDVNNPEAVFNEWQQDMLAIQRSMVLVQAVGVGAQVAIQGAANADKIAGAASSTYNTVYDAAKAHPYIVIASGIGIIGYGGYKLYKWMTTKEHPHDK